MGERAGDLVEWWRRTVELQVVERHGVKKMMVRRADREKVMMVVLGDTDESGWRCYGHGC